MLELVQSIFRIQGARTDEGIFTSDVPSTPRLHKYIFYKMALSTINFFFSQSRYLAL